MTMLLKKWGTQAYVLQPPALPSAVFPARADYPTEICASLCDLCCPPAVNKPKPMEASSLWTPTKKAPAPKLTYRNHIAIANGTYTPATPLKPAVGGSTLTLPPNPDSERRLAVFAEVERRRAIAERAAPLIAELEAPGELLDLVISTKRQMAQLEATQLAAINELSGMYPGIHEFLPTELAMALCSTDKIAQDLLDLGYHLPRRYPKTWAQLRAGNIRAELAKIVHSNLENCTDEVAGQVDIIVAPKLASLRPSQVSRLLAKTILEIDAAGAEDRRRKRRADRHVYRRPAPDGMAHMGFYSTAADINIIYEGLTAAAETAWTPGDNRSNSQRRIDTIVDLMRHALDTDLLPATIHQLPPVPTNSKSVPSTHASHASTTLIQPNSIPTNPSQGDAAPTLGVPQLPSLPTDREKDAGGADPMATIGTLRADNNQTAPVAPCAQCGHHAGLSSDAATPVVTRRGSARAAKYSIGVLIPMNTLLGGNDPAYITGQGWISAHQARILATDHTWRRILTDPVSEQIVDIGRKRYRPPAAMAELVRTRDQYCAAPGCTQDAKYCALDHIEPFKPGQAVGGSTSVGNIGPLCEHHHRAKDGGGFTLRRTDGVYHWTTPMDREYQHSPDRPWMPAPGSPHHPDNWHIGEEKEFEEFLYGDLDESDPTEVVSPTKVTDLPQRTSAA